MLTAIVQADCPVRRQSRTAGEDAMGPTPVEFPVKASIFLMTAMTLRKICVPAAEAAGLTRPLVAEQDKAEAGKSESPTRSHD